MSLESLKKAFAAIESSNSITFDALLANAGDVPALQLVHDEFDSGGLSIDQCTVAIDANCLRLAGVLTAGNVEIAGVRLALFPSKENIGCNLSLFLHQAEPWSPKSFPEKLGLKICAVQLESSHERFHVGFWAEVELGRNCVLVSIEIPGGGEPWVIRLGALDSPVTLADVISAVGIGEKLEAVLPWKPDLFGLADFCFVFDPDRGVESLSLTIASTKEVPLIEDGLVVQHLVATVSVIRPFDTKGRSVECALSGLLDIGSSTLRVQALRPGNARSHKDWIFRGRWSGIPISKLLGDLATQCHFEKPPLPAALSASDLDIELDVDVEIGLADGTFRFCSSAHGSFSLTDDGPSIVCEQAAFELARKVTGTGDASYPFSISLALSNSMNVVPGFTLKRMDLNFKYDNGNWGGGGSTSIDVLDNKNLTLKGNYSEGADGSKLLLEVHNPDGKAVSVPLVDASLQLKTVSLELGRRENGDGASLRSLTFAAESRFHVGKHININSCWLGFAYKKDRGERTLLLCLNIEVESARIALPMPKDFLPEGLDPAAQLERAGLFIEKDANKNWSFGGFGEIAYSGFPAFFPLPTEETKCEVRLSTEEFSIIIDNVAEVPVDFGSLPNDGTNIGKGDIALNEISLRIGPQGIEFGAKPGITLPSGINEVMFGKRSDGSIREVFDTDEAFAAALTFGLTKDGPVGGARLASSPFNAIKLEERSDGTYWPVGNHQVGIVDLKVPDFELKSGGFKASGGFSESEKYPLQIPLTPLKDAFSNFGKLISEADDGQSAIPDIGALLPDAIPLLKKPVIIPDEHFVESITEYLSLIGELPEPLVAALQRIGKLVSGLPTRLVEDYLKAELPNSFFFDITASPSGSVTFDVHVGEGRPPVTMLMPNPTGLIGVRLSNVSFGPIFGGSLFQLKLSADFDLFDPMTLAAAIVASQSETLKNSSWFPKQTESHATIRIRDLTMFIVYQAVVPIPIPLFYDELSISFQGPAGFGFKTGIRFNPLADMSIGGCFQSLTDLYKFIRHADFPLDPNNGIELTASVLETNLKLPPYLGGNTIGPDGGDLLDVDFWKLFANAANGVKFFRLDDLIAGVPIEYRRGSIDLKVASLEFKVAWAGTTRKEYEGGIQWDVPEHTPKTLVEFVPRAPDTMQGMVFLFAGEASIADSFVIDGRFGLVTTARQGAATSVYMHGRVGKLFEVEVSGNFGFDLSKPIGDGLGGFSGYGCLNLLGTDVLEVEVDLSDTQIYFHGVVDALPGLEQILSLTNDLEVYIDGTHFEASSKVEITLFGSSVGGTLLLTHRQFLAEASAHIKSIATMGIQLVADANGVLTVAGNIEVEEVSLAKVADEISSKVDATLNLLVTQLEKARDADAAKPWYWRKFPGLQGWKALIAAAQLLRESLKTTVTGVAAACNLLAGYLPADLLSLIQAINSRAKLIHDVRITYSASLELARSAHAELSVAAVVADKKVSWGGTKSLSRDEIGRSIRKAIVDATGY